MKEAAGERTGTASEAGAPLWRPLPRRPAPAAAGREADPESHVLALLVDEIVLGRLAPRERLVEEEIAARHGVKRHQARQALDGLEALGLVTKVRNRGAQVKEFSLDELEQIYSMRKLLQGEAARILPLPGDDEWIEALRTLQRAHKAALEAGDRPLAQHLNSRFHAAMFDACGNSYLAETIQYFELLLAAARSFRMVHPEVMLKAPEQHAAMIEAIVRGDREWLIELLMTHLRPARDTHALMRGVWFGEAG
jgi:DNA-binding GntR family transcriptional regulator